MSNTPGRRKPSGRKPKKAPTGTDKLDTSVTISEPETSKGGRPSKYSAALIEQICERLKKGEPMAVILRDEGMPSHATIEAWKEKHPGVSDSIAQARACGFDAIAADCLKIADDGTNDTYGDEDGNTRTNSDVIQRSKLRVETRLKLLAKWDAKRYGEKIEHTGEGLKTEMVVTVNLSETRRASLLDRRRAAMAGKA